MDSDTPSSALGGSSGGDRPDAVLMLIQSLDTRLKALEVAGKKPALKALTENAGAVALVLGLILTFASLYDVFVRKPEADRISSLSQFNLAVNSAVRTRQELIQQSQSGDPGTRLALLSMATPRILNDVSTAKAMLPTLNDADIGVPQLLTLISESMTAGDLASAASFVQRAVRKTDVTPLMQSEAQRYQGKYLYATGQYAEGRQAYERALALIGNLPASAAALAYTLADMLTMDYSHGNCSHVEADIQRLITVLNTQTVSGEMRSQIAAGVGIAIQQFRGKTCQPPANLALLQAG